MCGIIGVVSKSGPILDLLSLGLKRLEYRGYDSSGIAFVKSGKIVCVKSVGRTENICGLLLQYLSNDIKLAIGHTRWATHGAITLENAHPHITDEVAVVHNGIIENALKLRTMLSQNGMHCSTGTDTEVIPKLISLYLKSGLSIRFAIENLIQDLDGTFAIAAVFAQEPNVLVVAKRNASLLLGIDDAKVFVTSDIYTASSFTNKVIFLEENDYAFITSDSIEIYNTNVRVIREITVINSIAADFALSKNLFYKKRHFNSWMLKEIFEQPEVIENILKNSPYEQFLQILKGYKSLSCVTIVACGSSYFTAHIVREWLEEIGVRAYAEIASEFRYRTINIVQDEMVIFISQSGETADTLAALIACKKILTNRVISVTNVENSSISRMADVVIYTHAGHEMGVAATKTFIAQLTLFRFMIAAIRKFRNISNPEVEDEIKNALHHVDSMINNGLMDKLARSANIINNAKSVLYVGRGVCYGLAQEGALKLKELAYIHAEAIAAGELKHGSIALIDENMVVIVIAPSNLLFSKMHSNIEEIHARGGNIIAITDKIGKLQLQNICREIIEVPCVDKAIIPIIYILPLQIIAYQVAILQGCDVDHPRNLAKSVTVE